MFLCCYIRFHRHQLHLASYGCVSMSLILAGFVFTVFAIFQKDSQIGKIWLAGPVLIVVGAVLCGKVMIDWGPAMQRGRTSSLDSCLVDELAFSNLVPVSGSNKASLVIGDPATDLKRGRFSSSAGSSLPSADHPFRRYRFSSNSNRHSSSAIATTNNNNVCQSACCSSSSSLSSPKNTKNSEAPVADQIGPFDCIIYGPSEPTLGATDEKGGQGAKENTNKQELMLDKTTQAVERRVEGGGQGCQRCSTLWALLEGRQTRNEERSKKPKVIGKFVFAELLHGRQGSVANYGAMLSRNSLSTVKRNSGNIMMLNNHGERRYEQDKEGENGQFRGHSQGETMIMNERSFLI